MRKRVVEHVSGRYPLVGDRPTLLIERGLVSIKGVKAQRVPIAELSNPPAR